MKAPARNAVAAGKAYCCVITLPPTLTQALVMGQKLEIPLYTDPARATSGQIVESVLKQVMSQLSSGSTLFQISLEQLGRTGRLSQIKSID